MKKDHRLKDQHIRGQQTKKNKNPNIPKHEKSETRNKKREKDKKPKGSKVLKDQRSKEQRHDTKQQLSAISNMGNQQWCRKTVI